MRRDASLSHSNGGERKIEGEQTPPWRLGEWKESGEYRWRWRDEDGDGKSDRLLCITIPAGRETLMER